MNHLNADLEKSSNVLPRKVADEVTLASTQHDGGDPVSVYTLNRVGAFIWDMIDEKRKLSEIRDLFFEEFDIEKKATKDEESKELEIGIGNFCSSIKSETSEIIALLKMKYNKFLSNNDPEMTIEVIAENNGIPNVNQQTRYTKNDYFFIQRKGFTGIIDLSKNNAIMIIHNTSNDIIGSLNYFLRICYSFFVSKHNGFLLHAAGIYMEDKGYIFFGPSGSGKTTVAKLSHKFNILSDDIIIIKKTNGNYRAFGTPLSSSLDRKLSGTNDSMNINGLFLLKKDKRLYFKKINHRDSIVSLLFNIIYFQYFQYQAPNIMRNQFIMCCDILEETPCYEMHFTLSDSFWESVQNGIY